jgi:hypothetical protein
MGSKESGKKMTNKTLSDDDYNKLVKYAELEGSEVGEKISFLLNLYNLRDYIYTDGLVGLIVQELSETLKWFDENTEIVETNQEYKVQELNYK